VVSSLTKLKPEDAIETITRATDDPDYRVRVNSARALRTQPWNVSKPLFEKLLNDENVHVNVAAAEILSGVAKDTTTLHAWAKAAKNWRTQATLYSKLKGVDKEVKSIYASSNNDYQKAALLSSLTDADFVFEQFKTTTSKVIKSSAASVLAHISTDLGIFKQIIADGDQGAIIYACGALQDTTLGFKKIIKDYSFLEVAKSKLSLPRDYETYAPLEETLNYLKGLPPPEPLKNEFNHPIDWDQAASIAKDQRVLIKTSKGDIIMQLFVEEAPGSVVNFVTLVKSGYFSGKFFHRVVPNFVIQTGCNRGDGFGSEDYSIRSEFSQRKYKTGSVGMASAGKDTEGTQWFITHSPTPHLDGKYTIFAEVVSGMDVVHQVEVGDRIIEASLIKD
jgi:cyclophilin family peptidyl-prolyl cis-trans isomerase